MFATRSSFIAQPAAAVAGEGSGSLCCARLGAADDSVRPAGVIFVDGLLRVVNR